MAIEELRPGSFGIRDPLLLQRAGGINPHEVLGQLGLSDSEIEHAMVGDVEPIARKYGRKISVVDFDKILDSKLPVLSKELCSSFFSRAKSGEDFTQEEVGMYGDTYRRMFEGFFGICSDHVFRYEDPSDARNLLVRFDGETYQMTVLDEEALILYVGSV